MPRVQPRSFHIGDIQLEVTGVNGGALALLFIREGTIDFLEEANVCREWPNKPKLVSISYHSRKPRSEDDFRFPKTEIWPSLERVGPVNNAWSRQRLRRSLYRGFLDSRVTCSRRWLANSALRHTQAVPLNRGNGLLHQRPRQLFRIPLQRFCTFGDGADTGGATVDAGTQVEHLAGGLQQHRLEFVQTLGQTDTGGIRSYRRMVGRSVCSACGSTWIPRSLGSHMRCSGARWPSR